MKLPERAFPHSAILSIALFILLAGLSASSVNSQILQQGSAGSVLPRTAAFQASVEALSRTAPEVSSLLRVKALGENAHGYLEVKNRRLIPRDSTVAVARLISFVNSNRDTFVAELYLSLQVRLFSTHFSALQLQQLDPYLKTNVYRVLALINAHQAPPGALVQMPDNNMVFRDLYTGSRLNYWKLMAELAERRDLTSGYDRFLRSSLGQSISASARAARRPIPSAGTWVTIPQMWTPVSIF